MTASDKVLDLIGEVQGMLELDELIDGILAAIGRNVPSDYVSLNDIGPDTDRVISVVKPEPPAHLYPLFGEFAFQNPLMLRYMETLDGRPYRLVQLDHMTRTEIAQLAEGEPRLADPHRHLDRDVAKLGLAHARPVVGLGGRSVWLGRRNVGVLFGRHRVTTSVISHALCTPELQISANATRRPSARTSSGRPLG